MDWFNLSTGVSTAQLSLCSCLAQCSTAHASGCSHPGQTTDDDALQQASDRSSPSTGYPKAQQRLDAGSAESV
jgi:hypothetical protein